jgi:hypothetical protein
LGNYVIIESKILIPHQRFTREFQQDAFVLWNHEAIADLRFQILDLSTEASCPTEL